MTRCHCFISIDTKGHFISRLGCVASAREIARCTVRPSIGTVIADRNYRCRCVVVIVAVSRDGLRSKKIVASGFVMEEGCHRKGSTSLMSDDCAINRAMNHECDDSVMDLILC